MAPPRKLSAQQIRDAAARLAAGDAPKVVAGDLGCSRVTLWRVLKQQNAVLKQQQGLSAESAGANLVPSPA
jgi:hypothetical protein